MKGAVTQVTLILSAAEARGLAVQLMQAAEKCTEEWHHVNVHSFGSHVGAWQIKDIEVVQAASGM